MVCVKNGYCWISTTVDAFWKCNCSGCGGVERLVNGVWVSISQKRGKRKKYAKYATFLICRYFSASGFGFLREPVFLCRGSYVSGW